MPRDIHIKIFKDGHYLIAKGELDDKNTLITQGTDEQNLREMIVDAMSVLWNIKTPYEALQELEKEIDDNLTAFKIGDSDYGKLTQKQYEVVSITQHRVLSIIKSKKESLK